MHIIVYKDGKGGKFEVGDEEFEFNFKHNSINIKLPFDLDLNRLAQELKKDGYFVDEELEGIDSRSWGYDFDFEGYYPYSVYNDRDKWYFSFPPEDYNVEMAKDSFKFDPTVGKEAVDEFRKWLPFLKKAKK